MEIDNPENDTPVSKIKQVRENLGDQASRIGSKATEGYDEIRSRVSVYQEGAGEFLDGLAIYIKENPQKSALIAGATGVGLGVILGLLMRNGRD